MTVFNPAQIETTWGDKADALGFLHHDFQVENTSSEVVRELKISCEWTDPDWISVSKILEDLKPGDKRNVTFDVGGECGLRKYIVSGTLASGEEFSREYPSGVAQKNGVLREVSRVLLAPMALAIRVVSKP